MVFGFWVCVSGFGFMVLGVRMCLVFGFWFWVSGFGFLVLGFWFWDYGFRLRTSA